RKGAGARKGNRYPKTKRQVTDWRVIVFLSDQFRHSFKRSKTSALPPEHISSRLTKSRVRSAHRTDAFAYTAYRPSCHLTDHAGVKQVRAAPGPLYHSKDHNEVVHLARHSAVPRQC
ncbi:MAG: hypothetical protein M3N23_02490, partial [Pseudomonadota bacterium]|nr:hypothetical protein [Pseudomonadota bacterium]